MSFMPELGNLSLDELIARFRGPATEHEDEEQVYYDEIAYRMPERHGENGTIFLLEELERVRDDEIRLQAALGGLRFLPPHHPLGTQIHLFYINHANELVVMTAIDGLAQLEATEAHDRVLSHLAHRSQYVVGAVLRYMSRLFRDEAMPILLEALHDERYIVRECAVDELDELDPPAFDAEVASDIRPLLDDSHPDVRSAARWYFAHLAGKCEPDEDT
jgi:HEAT repeat protein